MTDNIYRRYRHGRGYIFCFYVGNRISSLTSVSHFFFLFFFFLFLFSFFFQFSFTHVFFSISLFSFSFLYGSSLSDRLANVRLPNTKGSSDDHRKRSTDTCILPISQGSRYYCTCKETIGKLLPYAFQHFLILIIFLLMFMYVTTGRLRKSSFSIDEESSFSTGLPEIHNLV